MYSKKQELLQENNWLSIDRTIARQAAAGLFSLEIKNEMEFVCILPEQSRIQSSSFAIYSSSCN